MSAAPDLYAPQYAPVPGEPSGPSVPSVPFVPRRHLAAVPDDGGWSVPARTAPVAPGDRRLGSVSVLHAPEPTATPLRLTRRGVVVLSILVAGLGAAMVWIAALSHGGADAGSGTAPAAVDSVTVEAGDTLWSIAGRVAPNADPRAEVEQLRRLNGIDDAALEPGQHLRVR